METIINKEIAGVLGQFALMGTVENASPLGHGLINDTYRVHTSGASDPDYVLQRINDNVFQDVPQLQRNIEAVTNHIRRKLQAAGTSDIDRRVLRFIPTHAGTTWCRDGAGNYWRLSVFIDGSKTVNTVSELTARQAGQAFGDFEAMLADLPEPLAETIPDFHNMELRGRQLEEAVDNNVAGRLGEVGDMIFALRHDMYDMCCAERLHRDGLLPQRVCHCDSKVDNMLLDDATGDVLCVVDLDTTMPSYVFSDYGDFLRTAASTVREDEPDVKLIEFREDIFKAFTDGYLSATRSFLLPVEKDHLAWSVALFPFMQCTRFLTDYLNGDTYYKTSYATHNLDRARNQLALYRKVRDAYDHMDNYIQGKR